MVEISFGEEASKDYKKFDGVMKHWVDAAI